MSQEQLTVTWGEEKLTPIKFNSFSFGGLSYTTNIKDSETPEEAYQRAWDFLNKIVEKQYIERKNAYYERLDAFDSKPIAKNVEEFPKDPLAKSIADLVTAKQLGMIRALARELGINHEEECQSVLGCNTDELSKRAASSLIEHLKKLIEASKVY